MPLIEMTDIKKDYLLGETVVHALKGIDLTIAKGEFVAVWGPSYLFSPSNPFFRDNGRSNPKREVPEMDFARLVWLPGISYTISFIANLDEGRQEFRFY